MCQTQLWFLRCSRKQKQAPASEHKNATRKSEILQLQLGGWQDLTKARQITLKAQKGGGGDILKILKFGTFVHKMITQSLYICL